jgi:hypothetical protein
MSITIVIKPQQNQESIVGRGTQINQTVFKQKAISFFFHFSFVLQEEFLLSSSK